MTGGRRPGAGCSGQRMPCQRLTLRDRLPDSPGRIAGLGLYAAGAGAIGLAAPLGNPGLGPAPGARAAGRYRAPAWVRGGLTWGPGSRIRLTFPSPAWLPGGPRRPLIWDGGLRCGTWIGTDAARRPGPAAQAAEWDARYSERDGARWSGRPNGRLAAEVASLKAGRALDVGCGEGADAIWLARSGWTVTAIEISEVAVTRAREAAGRAGAVVEWVRGDALRASFPAGSFDLVAMQYPARPKAAGEAPWGRCSARCALAGCSWPSTMISPVSTAST